jgi:hypothetical protein
MGCWSAKKGDMDINLLHDPTIPKVQGQRNLRQAAPCQFEPEACVPICMPNYSFQLVTTA